MKAKFIEKFFETAAPKVETTSEETAVARIRASSKNLQLLTDEVNKKAGNNYTPRQIRALLGSKNHQLGPYIDKLINPGGALYSTVALMRTKGIKPDISNVFISPYKINYAKGSPEETFGACEVQGERPKQEDRILMEEIELDLTKFFLPINWKTILQNTAKQLQAETNKLPEDIGSTLCANIVVGNKIINANLGDSESFLVRIKKDGTVELTPLHAELHNLNEKEQKRVKEAGGKLRVDKGGITRIQRPNGNDGIALSGAIGDRLFGNSLIHTPAVKETVVNELEPGEKAFIITACDGLREGLPKLEDNLKRLVELHKDKPPEEIAKALALEALKKGSEDNISVIVQPFDPRSQKPLCSAVFDGHNGEEVADLLFDRFYPILLQCIKKEWQDAYRAVNMFDVPQTSNVAQAFNTKPILKSSVNIKDELQRAWDKYQNSLYAAELGYKTNTYTPTLFQEIVGAQGFIYSLLNWFDWFGIFKPYLDEAVSVCNPKQKRDVSAAKAQQTFKEDIERISKLEEVTHLNSSEIEGHFQSVIDATTETEKQKSIKFLYAQIADLDKKSTQDTFKKPHTTSPLASKTVTVKVQESNPQVQRSIKTTSRLYKGP